MFKMSICMKRNIGLIIPFVLLLLIPFIIKDSYFLYVLVLACIYAILASSFDFLVGYTGLLSYGHAAFFGIGAYASALLTINTPIPAYFNIIFGGIISALLGLVLGYPCLRLKGPYLSITTLGFAEIMRLVISNEAHITRGPLGLEVPSLPGAPTGEISYHIFNYYIVLILLVVCVAIMYCLLNSGIGLTLKAIREDDVAAEAVGINTSKYKIFAFMISAFFAGIAGGFYGHYVLLISPQMLTLATTFLIISMSMFGGLGTLFGPIIGAIMLTFMNEYLRVLDLYRLLVFALILIIVITFFPKGIYGFLQKFNKKWFIEKFYINFNGGKNVARD